jgi:hypothetical protein
MDNVFYRIRKKGTTDLFSTGGQEPYWSKVGKTWTKLAHLKCHLQQVEPMGRRTSGAYRYRHSGMEKADYTQAEVVTCKVVTVEVQDASSFIQGAKDRKAAREQKREETRQRGRQERGTPLKDRHQEPVMEVQHGTLTRADDESPYRSNCPVCKDGVLLVGRDWETGELEEMDHCMACGQRFRYLDIERMRRELR